MLSGHDGVLRGSRLLLVLMVAGASLTPAGEARADPARIAAYGRHLAQECTTCHRLDGVDNGIPSIIGWDTATFRTTLQFYKEGLRNNQAMVSVAQSLDGEQIEALAAYFSGLPKPVRKR